MIRPRFGHGSDRGGRRTPWILGGMAVLAVGAVMCALASVLIVSRPAAGLALAVAAYALVGLGVGAAGTSLLALMATRVEADRRAAAATIMWLLMMAGFAVTATAGRTFPRSVFAPAPGDGHGRRRRRGMAARGGRRLERRTRRHRQPRRCAARWHPIRGMPSRRSGPNHVRVASRCSCSSMLAYSAQELILEPFSGLVFGYSLGDVQPPVRTAARRGVPRHDHASARPAAAASDRCAAGPSAAASPPPLAMLGAGAAPIVLGPAGRCAVAVFLLGVANGMFAVAAIGSMMELSTDGHRAAPARAWACGARRRPWRSRSAACSAPRRRSGCAISGSPVSPTRSCSAPRRCCFSGCRARGFCRGARCRPSRGAPRRASCDSGAGMSDARTAEPIDVVVVGGGPVGRDRRNRSGAPRPQRAAARSRRPHQALRRRHTAAS